MGNIFSTSSSSSICRAISCKCCQNKQTDKVNLSNKRKINGLIEVSETFASTSTQDSKSIETFHIEKTTALSRKLLLVLQQEDLNWLANAKRLIERFGAQVDSQIKDIVKIKIEQALNCNDYLLVRSYVEIFQVEITTTQATSALCDNLASDDWLEQDISFWKNLGANITPRVESLINKLVNYCIFNELSRGLTKLFALKTELILDEKHLHLCLSGAIENQQNSSLKLLITACLHWLQCGKTIPDDIIEFFKETLSLAKNSGNFTLANDVAYCLGIELTNQEINEGFVNAATKAKTYAQAFKSIQWFLASPNKAYLRKILQRKLNNSLNNFELDVVHGFLAEKLVTNCKLTTSQTNKCFIAYLNALNDRKDLNYSLCSWISIGLDISSKEVQQIIQTTKSNLIARLNIEVMFKLKNDMHINFTPVELKITLENLTQSSFSEAKKKEGYYFLSRMGAATSSKVH